MLIECEHDLRRPTILGFHLATGSSRLLSLFFQLHDLASTFRNTDKDIEEYDL
jgi:hypothetical protein